MDNTYRFSRVIVIIFLSAIAAVIWYADFYTESHRGLLTLTVFDVGQGDGIFIEAPTDNQVLIDGGPDDRILAKLGRKLPFWDRSIDVLVLTHAHADHVAGLIGVLRRYRVDMIIESGEAYSTSEYDEWHKLIREKEIPVVVAERGEVVHLGGGAELLVLSPFENENGASFKNPHDANVSAKLIYGSTSALLMGDAEKLVEYRMLLENSQELKSDILKIGHHGSKTSSAENFLERVAPQFAVISAGRRNRYGHPHLEVLDRLKALNITLFRTDENGDIGFVSDGNEFKPLP